MKYRITVLSSLLLTISLCLSGCGVLIGGATAAATAKKRQEYAKNREAQAKKQEQQAKARSVVQKEMRAAIEEHAYSKACPALSGELEGRLEKNGWSIDEADETKVVTYWDYVAGDWEDDRESYEHRYYFDLKDADGGCRVEATYNKKGDAVNGSMVSTRKYNKELELISWQSPETAEQIRADYEATYQAELEKLQGQEGEDADEPSDQDPQKSAETSVDNTGAGS